MALRRYSGPAYSASAKDLSFLEKDLRETIQALKDVPKGFTDAKIRAALRHALQPVLETAKALTPKGQKVHYRYQYKYKGSKRAAKGKGKVVGVYYPGHLRKSMSILQFRKAKQSLFVGPTYKRGSYVGRKKVTDGYYAAMVYGSATAFRKRIGDIALGINAGQVSARFFSKVVRIIEDIKIKTGL
jgi:hypothetical protein